MPLLYNFQNANIVFHCITKHYQAVCELWIFDLAFWGHFLSFMIFVINRYQICICNCFFSYMFMLNSLCKDKWRNIVDFLNVIFFFPSGHSRMDSSTEGKIWTDPNQMHRHLYQLWSKAINSCSASKLMKFSLYSVFMFQHS